MEAKPYRLIQQRRRASLLAFLRSIHQDSLFVREVVLQYPGPVLSNLRCGEWYVADRTHGSAYFKSTDGHSGQETFSFTRLNLNVAALAAERGVVLLVDSTSRGKAFPDALSRTVPIWCAVLNTCVALERRRGGGEAEVGEEWDNTLVFPPWVHESEHDRVAQLIGGWAAKLARVALSTDGLLTALCATLAKPLRPLFVGNASTLEAECIPPPEELPFTPIVLVSASKQMAPTAASHRALHSWPYIQGAGDDHEGWARGLAASEWWSHADELLGSGSDEACAALVDEIVARRVAGAASSRW